VGHFVDSALHAFDVEGTLLCMKIAIAGGGIGGMALALSLAAAGYDDVDIFESAAAIRELGVGINVLPHGARELAELGLLDELLSVGIPTSEFVYYSRHGQTIWGEPLGLAAGYRWPQISIHRGELLGILNRAVVERLGAHRVHTAHHLAGFGEEHRGVWTEFVDRASGSSVARAEADLLVGCDGIHSSVRRSLYPDEGPPRWNGVVMWRGLARGDPFLSGRTMINVGSSRQRVVVYPISRAEEDRGQALINWVATVQTGASIGMPPQDWTYVAQCEDVLAPFASFAFDFLDIPSLIRGSETIYQYPMADRDPLPSWVSGHVTVLGDAAHPMHPIGANGASQAIIDARVLARELALQPTLEAALAAYDAMRRPATASVVQSNRRAGPHRCQDLVEERAPNGFVDLSEVVSRQELDDIALDYKRTAGFEIDGLNQRPSFSVKAGGVVASCP
jgi:2-polyprenyl-6-methoxyphenol hydroxylase-like FAD-dependent oxidoreductase